LVIWVSAATPNASTATCSPIWKQNYATDAWAAPPCGHYVPEEAPEETFQHFMKHFAK